MTSVDIVCCKGHLKSQNAGASQIAKCVKRWLDKMLRVAFEQWRTGVMRARLIEIGESKLLRRRLSSLLRCSFDGWRGEWTRKKSAKRVMSMALETAKVRDRRLQQDVLKVWVGALRESRVKREAASSAVGRAVRRWEVGRLRNGLNRWREGVFALKVTYDVACLRKQLASVEAQVRNANIVWLC